MHAVTEESVKQNTRTWTAGGGGVLPPWWLHLPPRLMSAVFGGKSRHQTGLPRPSVN